jgi:transcriptional regulator with XRE-family HTH domain
MQAHRILLRGEYTYMDIIKVFACNVKKYRSKMGLSQESFAEKAGLHRTYISALEREKRSIALENVQKIADALGIETYLLFIDNSKNEID